MLHAKLYLPDPQKDEKIEMVVRRHSFVFFNSFILHVLLLAVPWVFAWFIRSQFSAVWVNSYLHPIFFLIGSVYTLFIILFLYSSFIDYWLDVGVITNLRIITLEQNGIFFRTFAEQELSAMQDVSSKVNGFFPTFLHYGDVMAQSAGSVQNAILEQVPNPDATARKIMELMEKVKQNTPGVSPQ